MVMRYRRLFEASKVLPSIISGKIFQKQFLSALALLAPPLHPNGLSSCKGEIEQRLYHLCRYSTVPQALNDLVDDDDILSFIESALEELEGKRTIRNIIIPTYVSDQVYPLHISFLDRQGTNHYWLNKAEESKGFLDGNKFSVTLVGMLPENFLPSDCRSVVEKLKSIQQRYPNLFVMGFLHASDASSQAYRTHLAELIIKEYVNFPILLVNKHYSKISNEHNCILLRGSRSPELYHDGELNNEVLDKAMEESSVSKDEWQKLFDNSSWVVSRHNNASKEPYICSLMQNMLLSSPGCISADGEGQRLFLSDSNHHRIIVSSGGGEILDCIGSSPGFEDGDFDSVKLLCPGSSFYCADEDCLYFVDSENHAIRRADMEKRVVDTIYPKSQTNKKTDSFWSWITNTLGFQSDVVEPEISDTQVLVFPWHLIQSKDDKLYIINRIFETLWVLDLASGEIEQTIKGYHEIFEICEELIAEKISLVKQIPSSLLRQQALANLPPDDKQHTSLLSSFTTLGKSTILYDTAGQSVLKFCRESGAVSNLSFSNFAVLGLPYWFSSSLEQVYTINSADGSRGAFNFHAKRFILLPGRVDIQLNVDIPIDTELVEPLKDSNIWRQTRGAATEVSGSNNVVGITEKVGVAQQWYDELDGLAFEEAEPESIVGEDEEDENNSTETSIADRKVQISCSVNTSPGTTEVIIFAGLYLKLKPEPGSKEDSSENYARRLAELLVPEGSGESEKGLCYQILLKSNMNLRDIVFTKPLHVRIRLDSRDHAKGDTLKDTLLTDSSIKFDLSL